MDISSHIEKILKPLLFASKDGFAHVESVKGVEGLITRLFPDSSLTDPAVSSSISELKRLFAGFDSLERESKKERIQKAFSVIESISRGKAGAPIDMTPAEAARKLSALKTPLQYVKGIGPKLSERFREKGLNTVEDMLYFLPIRYEDRTNVKKIRDLTPGLSETAIGEVLALGESRYTRRKVFEVAIGDGTGILKLKWFNYKLPYMKRYKQGQRLSAYGAISHFGGQKEIIHPDIEMLDAEEEDAGDKAANASGATPDNGALKEGVVPIYSAIQNLHQKTIRRIVRSVVEGYAQNLLGGTPGDVLIRHGVMDAPRAVTLSHIPDSGGAQGEAAIKAAELARKSLVFDELFLLELALAQKRGKIREEKGIQFFIEKGRHSGLEERLRVRLPFRLTGAQERALVEIRKDMASSHPMNRLVQGDVGSGKTVVSFISSLWAIESGYQAVIMAPTEILAEQHYLNTRDYSEAVGIKTVLIKGKMRSTERNGALAGLSTGSIDLAIGTHALLEEDVRFARLGLVIVDEQHRFGVVQRAALKRKASSLEAAPDMLIMTATPIPRTMSMTVFGDLDVSVIDELPPGRRPVETKVIREKDRGAAYEEILRELRSGNQAYIVYPLVEESEELSLKDATSMRERLQNGPFRDFRVGLLHGRLKPQEKEEVMRDFKEKKIDVLVSTTVIEVGVDVPNATIMLVEHAERFGLSQLHQLRGRVGRSDKRSYCLLLAQWTNTEDTYKRLRVMEMTTDGFRIAEEDLKLRGPGDFLGTRQSGLPDFRLSEVLGDSTLIKKARDEAFAYAQEDSKFFGPEPSYIKEVLKARWEGRFELAEIG